jgi:acyl-coenzyme A synthetase/AMP-(fatty) acid ligase
MQFNEAIFFHAGVTPHKLAMGLGDRAVTYEIVARGILVAEERLRESGLTKSDLVAVQIENPIAHVIVVSALYRAGIVSVSIEAPNALTSSGLPASVVLTDSPTNNQYATTALIVDEGWFSGWKGSLGAPRQPQRFDHDEVCRIILSSGTTGSAKPLVLTPRIMAQRLYTRIAISASVSADRILVLPGLVSQIGWTSALVALCSGGTAYFANSAELALQIIDLSAITSVVATAQQIRDLVNAQAQRSIPCHSLRLLQTGGGLISDSLMRDAQTMLCNRVLCRYGSTEVGIAAFAPGELLRGVVGAVGVIAPWATVQVVDDAGIECEPGTDGILRISTGAHCAIYDPNQRVHLTPPDDWFYPGDRGKLMDNGVLVLTGRTSEIINIGGAKIAPEAIEGVLLSRGDLKDAAAVGVVGPSGIEEIWIAIVPVGKIVPAEVIAYVAERMPAYVPSRVVTVGFVPRNQAGKIMREVLRKALIGSNPPGMSPDTR